MPMQLKYAVPLFAAAASFIRCQTLSRGPGSGEVTLVTDPPSITAYHRGIGYVADIGFTLSNDSGRPISRTGCGGPGFPQLEKKVGGRWIPAYYEISLLCRTIPDYSWEAGSRSHAPLKFEAFERGYHTEPELLVDSIDGIYRLTWNFSEGKVAGGKGAKTLTTLSNQFRMTLASQSSHDS